MNHATVPQTRPRKTAPIPIPVPFSRLASAIAAVALLTGFTSAGIASADDAPGAAGSAAVADVTTAHGFSFDQIDRDITAGAPPPAPGDFPTEYAALTTSQGAADKAKQDAIARARAIGSTTAAVSGIGSVVPVVGDLAARAAAVAARSAMRENAKSLTGAMTAQGQHGDLSHVDVLGGAVRRVDPWGTVYISKPGMPVIRLDTEAHTYHRLSPAEMDRAALAARFPNAGTVDVHDQRTTEPLAPATIEGQPAHGDRVTATLSFANATGTCPQANIHVTATEYTVERTEPDLMMLPLDETVVTLPCVGRFDSAANTPATPPRMVIYRSLRTDAPNGGVHVVERGNFRPLGPDAAALFEIPAGYKEQ